MDNSPVFCKTLLYKIGVKGGDNWGKIVEREKLDHDTIELQTIK